MNFLGEESADGGGTEKRVLDNLGEGNQTHSFFEGKGNRLVLRHDSVALVVSKFL